MHQPQAVTTIPQPAIDLPHPLLQSIRTDLLNALLLSGSARNEHETAAANASFLCALAQAHVLCFRASFHVIINHRGEKAIDVCFSYDPELECS